MDDVSCAVQHDVAVMSILDLEQETEHTIARHTRDEVTPRLQNTTGESDKELSTY